MKKIISLILCLSILISVLCLITLNSSASSNDGSVGLYCSTNPNGQCGKYKTMSIDGKISDWDKSFLIAQGVCNDDPRVYMDSSMHEIPLDTYALYAAWDDDNVYLMWEMKNVQDVVAPNDDFPLNPDNYHLYNDYGHNFPQYIVFNSGKRTPGDGHANDGKTIWQSGVTWEHGIDTFIATSNQVTYPNGPYCYQTNNEGVFVYNDNVRKDIKFAGGPESISEDCIGIFGAYGKYHNRKPGDIIDPSADWVDYYKTFTRQEIIEVKDKKGEKTGETQIVNKEYTHKKSMDFFFECSVPLSAIGVTRNDIETNGIEVMHVETFGTSGMNCLPVDLSMSDQANISYSVDPSTSHEKEDEDHITVPLAKIGVCSPVDPTSKPTIPTSQPTSESTKPTTQPTTEPITEPTKITEPTSDTQSDKYLFGDVDMNTKIEIKDATMIQQSLANMISLTDLQKQIAKVSGDSQMTVKDVTLIQQKLANIIKTFPAGEWYTNS